MEQHKHQCKIRQLLKWRKEWGKDKFREYLIKSKFDEKTVDDFIEQWKLGNKGEWGCWKSTSLQQQGLDI